MNDTRKISYQTNDKDIIIVDGFEALVSDCAENMNKGIKHEVVNPITGATVGTHVYDDNRIRTDPNESVFDNLRNLPIKTDD